MAAANLAMLFAISVFYWIFISVIQSPRFTNDYEFGISVSTYQLQTFQLKFCSPFYYLLIVPKWRE